MDPEACINAKLTHRNGSEQPLYLFIHNAVANIIVPIGWSLNGDTSYVEKTGHIRLDVLKSMSRETLDTFMHDIKLAEAALSYGSPIDSYMPSDDDVRRLFSTAYHLVNPDNKSGAADRAIIAKALEVLKLGEVLPDRTELLRTPLVKSDPKATQR